VIKIRWLPVIPRELGDDAECADAPAGLNVGKPVGKEVHEMISPCHRIGPPFAGIIELQQKTHQ
jgi:hypothetical protein